MNSPETQSHACVGSEPVPGLCPAHTAHVEWAPWFDSNVAKPFWFQACTALILILLVRPLYIEICHRCPGLKVWVQTFVGTDQKPLPTKPLPLLLVFGAEWICSLVVLVLWVNQSYTTKVPVTAYSGLACLHVLCWLLNRIRTGFTAVGLLHPDAIVDAVTLVPILFTVAENSWLTPNFLRVYSALFAFEVMQQTGLLRHRAVLVWVLVRFALQIITLVVIMAGTVFTCEILGDPQTFYDSFVINSVGDRVSFLQMVNWIIVSITTVGYGDFAPRTILSRIITSVFIVVGIMMIYFIQTSAAEHWNQQREGTGIYRGRSFSTRKHVVVILCLRGEAKQVSSLITGFLHEIFHPAHNEAEDHHDLASSSWAWIRDAAELFGLIRREKKGGEAWPDVVFFSPSQWSSDSVTFHEYLKKEVPQHAARRVSFLVGSLVQKNDLQRACIAESAITVILTDENSDDPLEDDCRAIHSAVLLKGHFPAVHLRLMLQLPESKEVAVQAGIEPTRCFSSRELKMATLAQNTRCHGLIAAITMMLKNADAEDEDRFLASVVQRMSKAAQVTEGGGSEPHARSTLRESCSSVAPINLAQGGGSMNFTEMLPGKGNKKLSGNVMGSLRNSMGGTQRRATLAAVQERRHAELDWVHDYFEGLQRIVVGFVLSEEYENLRFGELAMKVFLESGGAVLLGVQDAGRLVICPEDPNWRSQSGQVYFAITPDEKSLDAIRLKGAGGVQESWRPRFQDRRNLASKARRRIGPHIAAAELMGPKLLRCFPGREAKKEARDDEERRMVDPATSSALSDRDHLVVLIVCNGEAWQQILSFVNALRQPYQPIWPAITVVVPVMGDDTPEALLDLDDVCIVEGSCLQATVLLGAGVLHAQEVAVITGEVADSEERFRDHRVVLCSQVLDCWLGAQNHEVFCSFEFQDSGAVHQLPRLRPASKFLDKDGKPVNFMQTFFTTPQQARGSIVSIKDPDDGTTVSYVREDDDSQTQSVSFAAGSSAAQRVSLPGAIHSISSDSVHDESDVVEDADKQQVAYDVVEHPFAVMDSHQSMVSSIMSERSSVEPTPRNSVLSLNESGSNEESRQHPAMAGISQGKGSSSNLPMSRTTRIVEEDDSGGVLAESILFNSRFAAGQVFTPELWGMMVGRMYYMPATIELLEALVMPGQRGQEAFPWQVRIPSSHHGMKYQDLFDRLSRGNGFSASDLQVNVGCAIPIALYRAIEGKKKFGAGGGMGGRSYVMLAPNPTVRVARSDWLIVLGSESFGRQMYAEGLLRGAPDASGLSNPQGA